MLTRLLQKMLVINFDSKLESILDTLPAVYSAKNSGVNFQTFPGGNGTKCSGVVRLRLEFFDDFEG